MKRDPYECSASPRDADERTIKKSFRGSRASSTRTSTPPTRTRRRSSRRRPRRTRSSPTPSDAPSTTATGMTGSARAATRPNFQGFGSFADIFDAFFGRRRPVRAHAAGAIAGRRRRGRRRDLARRSGDGYDRRGRVRRRRPLRALPRQRRRAGHADRDLPSAAAAQGSCARSRERRSGSSCARRPATSAAATARSRRKPCARVRRARTQGDPGARSTSTSPPGSRDEQRIRLSGRGHAGERGGPAGRPLRARARRRRPALRARGQRPDHRRRPARAGRGARREGEVPTLDGDEELEIAARHAARDDVITLRGRGMPRSVGAAAATSGCVVNVTIPRNLSEDQRRLLERLSTSLTDDEPAATTPPRRIRSSRACDARSGERRPLIRLAVRGRRLTPRSQSTRRCSSSRRPASSASTATASSSSPSTARPASCRCSATARRSSAAQLVVVRGETVPEDWSERWKRFHVPLLLGGRLYVRPPWEEPAIRPGVARGRDRSRARRSAPARIRRLASASS